MTRFSPDAVPTPRQQALLRHLARAAGALQPAALVQALGLSRPTLNRELRELLAMGLITKAGDGRSTRYTATTGAWSTRAQPLVASLQAPLMTRTPVGYDQRFVADYVPNQSSLLPPDLAAELAQAGRSPDQQPAGTYAREVLEQLLIDLSWSSSRLEGNRRSLLDTQRLFELAEKAEPIDADDLMLLNHKEAIEFLVEAGSTEGLTVAVIVDLHAKLMRDLLKDARDIGRIRQRLVNIDGSVYLPCAIPALLESTLTAIVDKARQVHNPVEAAFFLWVQLAYLQPFLDGNKRTSRLAANVPLMLRNCAPLSFLDITRADYASAMLGVYEQRDVAAAVDLFEFTYRRSVQKYGVLRASLAAPDPLRTRYRQAMNELMQLVVLHGLTLAQAAAEVLGDLTADRPADRIGVQRIAATELDHLTLSNCARYNLVRSRTQRWIDAGRPR